MSLRPLSFRGALAATDDGETGGLASVHGTIAEEATHASAPRLRIAVAGVGVSGLSSAWLLAARRHVELFDE